MELLFALLILGGLSYLLFKATVGKITTTPVWLLWLVMMTPATIWIIFIAVFGEDSLPFPLLMIIFIVCLILYLWLIELGRQKINKKKGTTDYPYNLSVEQKTESMTELSNIRPINTQEENDLRNCFPWGVYYLENIDYYPQAILCRGKLRTVPEKAYHKIKENVERLFGDRFVVIFQESFQGQPFFALVPNPYQKTEKNTETESINRPKLALGLLFITLFTTTVMGVHFQGIEIQKVFSDTNLLVSGLPYSISLILILGCHELSHYFTAIHYKIKTTIPYFIPEPFLFLGTVGAFVQMRSPFPNRRALFDVAIAGPLGGLIITIPLLFWGLIHSEVVTLAENTTLLNFQSLDPRFSFLLSIIAKLALGTQLEPGIGINLHPVAIAGYIGLIVTALNLMPVGQLDGGHIVHAMFGQNTAAAIGQITRILMLTLSLIRGEFLIWAIILFLMPLIDQPALNDVTELDNKRDFFGLCALALLIVILLPLPITISQWLNF